MDVQAGWGWLIWGGLSWWEWLEWGEGAPQHRALALLGLRMAKGQESERKHAKSQKDWTQDSHTVAGAPFHGPK